MVDFQEVGAPSQAETNRAEEFLALPVNAEKLVMSKAMYDILRYSDQVSPPKK